MNIQDIRNSYYNSIEPNQEVCAIIESLVTNVHVKRVPKYKTDFLNLINTISMTNQHDLLPIFKDIVKNAWSKTNNDLFYTILKSQSLYSSIYAQLMQELSSEDQEYIISMFKTKDLSTKEMVTLGIFFGKHMLLSDNLEQSLDSYYSEFKEIRPTMVLST